MPIINASNLPKMDPIANGTYAAKFDEFENDIAGTDGSDMVKCTFVITEEGEYKGRKAWKNFSLKESAVWAFKRGSIALGASEEQWADEELDTDELLEPLVGADCRLVIKTRVYEGEKRSEVRSVLAPSYEFAKA